MCVAGAYAISTPCMGAARTEDKTSLDPVFLKFIVEKEGLAKSLAEKHQLATPPAVLAFFAAAQRGDWITTSNLFYALERGSGRRGEAPWLSLQLWGPIHDTFGTYEQFHTWHRRMGMEQSPLGSLPCC